MKEQLKKLRDTISAELNKNLSSEDLQNLYSKYMGRKGEFNALIKNITELSSEQKKEFGKFANQIKQEIEDRFNTLTNQIKDVAGLSSSKNFDVTLPGTVFERGSLHPITQMTHLIWETFSGLNFDVVLGPEIETDFYNFEALNLKPDHPARDMQATFFLTEKYLLRTHTSPMQVRFMEKHQPPVRIIVTGKCYRRDSDLTHSPMFNQFEGLMVGDDITMEHLKNILQVSLQKILEKEVKVRFRVSYFPFVEPGAEFDVSCTICSQKGCPTCKYTGWVELGGCGMVHPNVLASAGYDASKLQGFAFGFGIERVFMIKHTINDLRLFFANDLRFLKQF